MQHSLKIGTRGSPLALWQAHMVRDALLAAHSHLSPRSIEIVTVKTTGDKILDRPLAEIGGKGLFTKELEDGLYSGALDCAVHSTKDMPTHLPDGLAIDCFIKREDPRDALIAANGGCLMDLPQGAVVGSASLRRQAQLLALRPDLKVISFRGNVGTRLKKLAAGAADATLLAYAGMKRLGVAEKATDILSTDQMLPAPAQGAVCVECRADDPRIADLLAPLNDAPTAQAVTAERAFLAALEGNCRTPIAALATISGSRLTLVGKVLSLDGAACFEERREGTVLEAAAIGHAAGMTVRQKAGEDFLKAIALEQMG
ncbi:porphobilinogen deaminase [Iodidimonas muriae]|uniref:Porphobilinogen deaminase n=1 Tax=Iodidimonas muriae TaxID=261467 RepID=A0ABQ2L9V4_9PROT|nr:hydroxymethylbilane synthase [Iodidimonas muriae]GER06039.1 porphobilinogen deaminase [Kordiimonadales bacterium JCM 17843]GGO07994.1 porphobilinogen deaminase [Iodidimonas muriae]